MGDSTCLIQQPFCYASGITNEANENNPIHALGQSVSFGRFMSESLSWEKWSSFSHNRYVEEAERYSKPGSVAQKKAFFEAHYKKIAAHKAAAALLEQANNAASQNSPTEQDEKVVVVVDNGNGNSNAHNNSETKSPSSAIFIAQNNVTGQEDKEVIGDNSSSCSKMVVKEEEVSLLRANGNYSDSIVEASVIIPQSNKVEKAESEMEQEAFVGNSMKVELQNKIEDVDGGDATLKEKTEKIIATSPPVMTPTLKGSNSNHEILASVSKKKQPVSSLKLLKGNGTSKVTSTPVKSTVPISSKRDNVATMSNKKHAAITPVKPTIPISSKRDNVATPMSHNKHASLSYADKKRSTPKPLQMSVNFTPIRELNRMTASVMRKFENARVGASSSKSSKDAVTPLRTPTMTSKKEMQKHTALTPLTEKRRNKTPHDLSAATGNHTGRRKWRLLATEDKMRSPVISSPFSLRTEERAAQRKKKLEEKFNDNEAQKVVQLHTKLKEKAETEIRKLRQSFCFKARPLPDFYKERKSSNETKKDPLTHPESPKERRTTTPSVLDYKTSLPPNKPLLKNNDTENFMGKGGRTLAHHLTTNPMNTATRENTSPNIQKLNLSGTNYRY